MCAACVRATSCGYCWWHLESYKCKAKRRSKWGKVVLYVLAFGTAAVSKVVQPELQTAHHSISSNFCTVSAQDPKVEAIPNEHEGNALGPDRLQQEPQAYPLQDEGCIAQNANDHTGLMAA